MLPAHLAFHDVALGGIAGHPYVRELLGGLDVHLLELVEHDRDGLAVVAVGAGGVLIRQPELLGLSCQLGLEVLLAAGDIDLFIGVEVVLVLEARVDLVGLELFGELGFLGRFVGVTGCPAQGVRLRGMTQLVGLGPLVIALATSEHRISH